MSYLNSSLLNVKAYRAQKLNVKYVYFLLTECSIIQTSMILVN